MKQVEGWLREHFPTAYPVKVSFPRVNPRRVKNREWGECYRRGKRMYIRIDSRLTWHIAMDTLIHEWAHAISLKHESLESQRRFGVHDEEWGMNYARIYRAFFDEEGCIESRQYPER